MCNKKVNQKVTVQIPMPVEIHNKLRTLKGTKRSWCEFLEQELVKGKD